MKIQGRCSCGAITFAADGEAVVQAYCHCHSCQVAHSTPVMAVALFPLGTVTLEGQTRSMSITGRQHAATRISCVRCGTRVAVIPSGEGADQLRGLFPALCLSAEWFRPQMHLHWQERSIDVNDALPKYLDVPKEFGGTDRMA